MLTIVTINVRRNALPVHHGPALCVIMWTDAAQQTMKSSSLANLTIVCATRCITPIGGIE